MGTTGFLVVSENKGLDIKIMLVCAVGPGKGLNI